jgi:2',3'-cyclic-nucleotide 2'-phosphodiesterase (5'-nucleotidase family)
VGEDVHVGIINMGGLRTVIPKGKITVGNIFELMPFENELVVVWLKGDKLMELLQYFASMGGEGVSGVSMVIQKGKATQVLINGKELDAGTLYSVATNDYLADGNDNMKALSLCAKRVNTGQKVRDVLIKYIQRETSKGNIIQSKLDGRIK